MVIVKLFKNYGHLMCVNTVAIISEIPFNTMQSDTANYNLNNDKDKDILLNY